MSVAPEPGRHPARTASANSEPSPPSSLSASILAAPRAEIHLVRFLPASKCTPIGSGVRKRYRPPVGFARRTWTERGIPPAAAATNSGACDGAVGATEAQYADDVGSVEGAARYCG